MVAVCCEYPNIYNNAYVHIIYVSSLRRLRLKFMLDHTLNFVQIRQRDAGHSRGTRKTTTPLGRAICCSHAVRTAVTHMFMYRTVAIRSFGILNDWTPEATLRWHTYTLCLVCVYFG